MSPCRGCEIIPVFSFGSAVERPPLERGSVGSNPTCAAFIILVGVIVIFFLERSSIFSYSSIWLGGRVAQSCLGGWEWQWLAVKLGYFTVFCAHWCCGLPQVDSS